MFGCDSQKVIELLQSTQQWLQTDVDKVHLFTGTNKEELPETKRKPKPNQLTRLTTFLRTPTRLTGPTTTTLLPSLRERPNNTGIVCQKG